MKSGKLRKKLELFVGKMAVGKVARGKKMRRHSIRHLICFGPSKLELRSGGNGCDIDQCVHVHHEEELDA